MHDDPAADPLRFASADHRPWPLPQRRWTWRQAWRDLAFLHFPVSAESIRRQLPSGLTLQTFDGSAWVGVVPFRMCEIEQRDVGPVPCLEPFPELNVRTYVEAGGKPGVWFFSLDADSWPFVLGGRRLYSLPYHKARMTLRPAGDGFAFTSRRVRSDAAFDASYAPTADLKPAAPGTFEQWAAERYCLYAASGRGLVRVEVHHAPWPIAPARVDIRRSTLLDALGLQPLSAQLIAHFSPGVAVLAYPREPLAGV
jgi:uncharacterized protein